jgi:hypothetical protein
MSRSVVEIQLGQEEESGRSGMGAPEAEKVEMISAASGKVR